MQILSLKLDGGCSRCRLEGDLEEKKNNLFLGKYEQKQKVWSNMSDIEHTFPPHLLLLKSF